MAERLPDDFEFTPIGVGGNRNRAYEYEKYLDGKPWKVSLAEHGFDEANKLYASLRQWLKVNNHDLRILHGPYQGSKSVIVLKLVPFERPKDPNQNGQQPA